MYTHNGPDMSTDTSTVCISSLCLCVCGVGMVDWFYFLSHPQKLPSFIQYVPEDKHLLVTIKPAMLGHPSYQLQGDKE